MLREAQDSNPKSTIHNPKYESPVVGIILKGLINNAIEGETASVPRGASPSHPINSGLPGCLDSC